MTKYRVEFLEPVLEFIESLNDKSRKKVFYNIWKARSINDPELFKKLTLEIWEFKTKHLNMQIRLLAFWDKSNENDTLVIATNGFFKKTQKTPKAEIDKAERLRKEYFDTKKK
jgi:phage-related protein